MRVQTLGEWRDSWLTLPRVVRRICLTLLRLFAVLATLCLVVLVWEFKCDMPTGDAQRVLVRVVAITEKHELWESGRLGDIDAELRSERPYPRVIGLDHYRIIVQKLPNGYDVVIRPTSWCFCRATFILHDDGKTMEVAYPWLFHP